MAAPFLMKGAKITKKEEFFLCLSAQLLGFASLVKGSIKQHI